jgi:hypothetical protein
MKNNENKNNAKGWGVRPKLLYRSPCNFYLIEPKDNSNADILAERLMAIKDVEEVFVTDGDYGFVVRTKFGDSKSDGAYSYLSKKFGGSFGKVTSYYQYKK